VIGFSVGLEFVGEHLGVVARAEMSAERVWILGRISSFDRRMLLKKSDISWMNMNRAPN
jgi:hypothetical protein